jgi:acetylornithine deacetylase/succinyl-diaminopimelate desuccinylase-like protein
MPDAGTYIARHFTKYINDLNKLVAIPSISMPGYNPKNLKKAADKSEQLLKKYGIPHTEQLTAGSAPPYIFGSLHTDKTAPTILLYAHYDVQPPMREQFWKSPAFKPVKKGNRLYGRGTADDKGGILLICAAIDALLSQGKVNVNIKILLEGEEETGSENIDHFFKKYKKKLSADALVIADAANYDIGIPAITTSLRGIISTEITVSSTKQALHSGLWGGPVPDPSAGLSKILAGLTDADGKLNIPACTKGVLPLSKKEIDSLNHIPYNEKTFRKQTGMLPGVRLPGKKAEVFKRLWYEPSLVINSIESGSRTAAGNVIMDSTWARISIRTVPGMQSAQVFNQLKSKLKKLCPWGLQLSVSLKAAANPWKTDISHKIFTLAADAMTKGYKKKTLFTGCGATIPFVESLTTGLGGVPGLLIGVEDPYTNAHGENESLHLPDFKKAIISLTYFLQDVSTSI